MAVRIFRCLRLNTRSALVARYLTPTNHTSPFSRSISSSRFLLKSDPAGKPHNLPDLKLKPRPLSKGKNIEGFEDVEILEDGVDVSKSSVMYPNEDTWKWDRDAEDFPDIVLSTLTINFGPQHPAAHGVLRLIMEIEGEVSCFKLYFKFFSPLFNLLACWSSGMILA